MSIPRKPFSLRKSQTWRGMSLRSLRMSQSSIIAQSSLQGPSRKACSSAVSVSLRMPLSLLQSRLAREQLGVPADGAGIERFLLGARDARQDALDHAVDRGRDHREPDLVDREQEQDRARDQRENPAAEIGVDAEAAAR